MTETREARKSCDPLPPAATLPKVPDSRYSGHAEGGACARVLAMLVIEHADAAAPVLAVPSCRASPPGAAALNPP
jgi:hypothetical protein